MKAYFMISVGAVLVLALALTLTPIQYGATVHSGLATSHTKIDKGGVVESASFTVSPKLATMGGGGLGVIASEGSSGLVTATSNLAKGLGIFTLVGGEGHLIGGVGAMTVQVSSGGGISGQLTWFQDTPE